MRARAPPHLRLQVPSKAGVSSARALARAPHSAQPCGQARSHPSAGRRARCRLPKRRRSRSQSTIEEKPGARPSPRRSAVWEYGAILGRGEVADVVQGQARVRQLRWHRCGGFGFKTACLSAPAGNAAVAPERLHQLIDLLIDLLACAPSRAPGSGRGMDGTAHPSLHQAATD